MITGSITERKSWSFNHTHKYSYRVCQRYIKKLMTPHTNPYVHKNPNEDTATDFMAILRLGAAFQRTSE
ncbi:MAG: hypothetical protein HXS53_06675 [Theionarchaea archaeon]|nr:hypothetical protein [Theionarchaea archaeon]